MDDSQHYLVGWKTIARYVGVHFDTVRYWHRTRLKLPYSKSYPSKQGRPIVAVKVLDEWLKEMGNFKLNDKV